MMMMKDYMKDCMKGKEDWLFPALSNNRDEKWMCIYNVKEKERELL